jgi:hypothetical protein
VYIYVTDLLNQNFSDIKLPLDAIRATKVTFVFICDNSDVSFSFNWRVHCTVLCTYWRRVILVNRLQVVRYLLSDIYLTLRLLLIEH